MKLSNLNTLKTLYVFWGFLFYFFHLTPLSAQSINGKPNDSHSVVIGSGTQVYSDDVFFNKYLSRSNPESNHNTVKIITREGNKLIVSVEKKAQSLPTDLKKEVIKKREKEIAAIKKEVTRFEKQKSQSKQDIIHLPYSSYSFHSSQRGNWNYVIPTAHSKDYSASYGSEYTCNKTALGHLYSEVSTFYDSKIICYCFSTIHSARPPPAIL